jgi:predicted glycosyltransferase
MNILLFVNTPAQVHEFKYVAQTPEVRNYKIGIVARDYERIFSRMQAPQERSSEDLFGM